METYIFNVPQGNIDPIRLVDILKKYPQVNEKVYGRKSKHYPESKYVVITVLQIIVSGMISCVVENDNATNKSKIVTKIGATINENGRRVLVYDTMKAWESIPLIVT